MLVYRSLQRRQGRVGGRGPVGLITEAHADEERSRIRADLQAMDAKADFPSRCSRCCPFGNSEEAKRVAASDHDGVILYHATDTGNPYGGIATLMDLLVPDKLNVEFTRHRSGPAYRGYVFTHPQLLRQRNRRVPETSAT